MENKILKAILDLIYPPKCMFCGDILEKDDFDKTCKNCGMELSLSQSDNSVFIYDEYVRNAIHNFKYRYHPEYSQYLAKYMYKKLLGKEENYDYIIPIPMYNKKEKSRGYNQARLLAEEISKLTNIPLMDNIIIRSKNTAPQSRIDFSKRYENLKEAFEIRNEELIKGKKILLIDDIYTSGSTIRHCTYILRKNGAEEVDFLTLAKAEKENIINETM